MSDPTDVRHAALEAAINFADNDMPPSGVLHIAREFENYLLTGAIPGDAKPQPVLLQEADPPAAPEPATPASATVPKA